MQNKTINLGHLVICQCYMSESFNQLTQLNGDDGFIAFFDERFKQETLYDDLAIAIWRPKGMKKVYNNIQL